MGNKMTRKEGLILKFFEEALYISFVILGFYIAFLIKFDMNPSTQNIQPFIDSIPYIIIVTIVVFYVYNIVTTLKKSLFENVVIIILSLILIDIITMAVVFFNRGFAFPRSVFFIGFFIQFLLILTTKLIILKIIKLGRKKNEILIIASDKEAKYIAKKILLDKYNFDNIKYISNEINECTYELINDVDKIYIGSLLKNNKKRKVIKYCTDISKTIYLVPDFYEISLIGLKITRVNDIPVFKIEDMGLTYEQKLMKRIIDVVLSFVGLIILSPLMLIVSIVIKLYDKGPILYKQERVTKGNKVFNLYKFRTMIEGAEKSTGPILASEKDPRITSLGAFLRTSRIDELPQLFNVLKGDMSLVGPRPERPYFVEKFNKEIDEFKYRVSVKAGVTGLAQILGTYATDPSIKAKYDLLYIKDYSLLLDIRIIFNTVKIMFMKGSSKGVSKEKKLEEILDDLDLNVYKELGVTRIK